MQLMQVYQCKLRTLTAKYNRGGMVLIPITTQIRTSVFEKGMTDAQIARVHGISRTAVVHRRRRLGIEKTPGTGRSAETGFSNAATERGLSVSDMNVTDKLHPFDFLVNGLRVDVKGARCSSDGFYRFSLSERREKQCAVGETRILLHNGRTRKVFSATCDVIALVCLKDGPLAIYLLRPQDFPSTQQGISIRPTCRGGKYEPYRDNWSIFGGVRSGGS